MQEHEKNLMLLIVIGAAIGFAKLLVSDEKLTWRLIIGRTILGAATSTISGAIILQVPEHQSTCPDCHCICAGHLGQHIY